MLLPTYSSLSHVQRTGKRTAAGQKWKGRADGGKGGEEQRRHSEHPQRRFNKPHAGENAHIASASERCTCVHGDSTTDCRIRTFRGCGCGCGPGASGRQNETLSASAGCQRRRWRGVQRLRPACG
eukprot:222575-Chlamydomonas_euryale.AAC.5